ncbi:Type II secretion system (T2SS), protein F [compost metagenome]
MKVAVLLIGLSALLASLALVLFWKGAREDRARRVSQRLGGERVAPSGEESDSHWMGLERAFERAGMAWPGERRWLLLGAWALVALLGLRLGSWPLLLILLLVPPLLLHLLLIWRYRKRVRRMVAQLPQMLDQMLRSLKTGNTLSDALVRAIESSPQPLQSMLGRVGRNVQLGVAMPDALQEAADLYEQEELRILALGVRINHRYGGSSSDLIGGLIKLIHEREHIARQLRAMTGETRMTAVVLAVLPISLTGYILSVNPQYLLSMWSDSGGRQLLLTAFLLQAVGCGLLWRMLRSV